MLFFKMKMDCQVWLLLTIKKLLDIDNSNSTALNNIGVRFNEFELPITAIEHYRKSENLKETLAMSNIGYKLLNAGFATEAKKIATEALKQENIDERVHSLIADIKRKQNDEKKRVKQILQELENLQIHLRIYFDNYYIGKPFNFSGKWKISGRENTPVQIKTDENKIEIEWHTESFAGLYPGTKSKNINKISGIRKNKYDEANKTWQRHFTLYFNRG